MSLARHRIVVREGRAVVEEASGPIKIASPAPLSAETRRRLLTPTPAPTQSAGGTFAELVAVVGLLLVFLFAGSTC